MKKMISKRNLTITAIAVSLAMLCACAATLTGAGADSRVINAPVEKVFAFYSDPKAQLVCNPDQQITDVQGQGLGMTWSATAKDILGNPMTGTCVVTGYELNKLLEMVCTTNDGAINGTNRMIFAPTADGKTKVVQVILLSGLTPVASRGAGLKIIEKTKQVYTKNMDACIAKVFGS